MSLARKWATLLAAVILVGGCGLGQKQRYADRVMRAADKTDAAAVGGTLGAELRASTLPTNVPLLAISDVPVPATLQFGVSADHDRAVLRQQAGDLAVFEAGRILLRRPEATPQDARPWLELALKDVRAGTTPFDPATYKAGATYALLSVLDPQLLLDIAASPLTGSVETLGAEAMGGQSVERYRANFDIDKALENRRRGRYDGDRREQVRRVLNLLSISRTVNPGEVWLDASGLRRVQLELEVRPSRYAVSKLIVTIDLGGDAGTISVPDRRQTVVVDGLAALQRSAAQLSAAQLSAAPGA